MCDDEGSNCANKIAEEAAAYGVAGVLDAHTTKIYGNNIKGGVGRTLEDAA